MPRTIRGVEAQQEIKARTEWRDLRTKGERFRDWMGQGNGIFSLSFLILGFMWIAPSIMELTFAIGMLVFWWSSRLPVTLPFRLPSSAKMLDPNDPEPGRETPGKAAGIAFVGNEVRTRRELWFKSDDMRTHILIFGSTGSGKALPDEAPVHTPRGWVRLDALCEGDLVSTADGRSAPIVGVFPQGELELYRLVLEDGRSVLASGDHLWTVLPHRELGPVQTRGDGEGGRETIDTLTLQRRLELGQWPDGARGWALPMPAAPDAPEQPGAVADELAGLAVAALRGQGPWPDAVMDGSRSQRQAFWRPFWAILKANARVGIDGTPKGLGAEHAGRLSLIRAPNQEALKSLTRLAHSMGWWAAVEERRGEEQDNEFTAILRREEPGVRVLRVEKTGRKAPCRCIKIDDTAGLFLTEGFVVTHNTEALISLAYNALVQGSGFIYIDGKGDNKLWAKIFSICRSLGREDDLLVINYMTGGRDVFGPQKTKLSNTLNPFVNGSSAGLTELLVSLMDDAGGEGGMWKGRAVSLISAVMTALVYMRENEGLLLDVDVIREHLVLDNIQKLVKKQRSLPANIATPIRAYLRSLPGFQEVPQGGKQSETALEQHGYLQMQFTRILGSLSDTYGYIFRTNLGEVDFFDVVINRRILVVLLPAMEKSPDELGNLGKIIVACLKQMMATGLGDVLEGDYRDVIERKPTESPAPYMCILDEYGYYVVKGAAVMPAQARSLGFCMVFAGQDYPSFKKNNNSEEAAATIGNCNIKIWMKIEDPTDTYTLFKDAVGEANVSKTTGFVRETGVIGTSYSDQQNTSIERRNRGDWLDLKDQREGEAHILFKSSLIRAEMFYANPPSVPKLQMNYFLRVKPPALQEMEDFDRSVHELTRLLNDPAFLAQTAAESQPQLTLKMIKNVIESRLADGASAAEAALSGLVAGKLTAYGNLAHLNMASQGLDDDESFEDDEDDRMDAFGDGVINDGGEDFETPYDETNPNADRLFLDANRHRARMADIEEASGADPQTARSRAEIQASDMQTLSSYPRRPPPITEADEIIKIIGDLSSALEDDEDEQRDDKSR